MPREPATNKRLSPRLHHELPVSYRTVGSFLSDWATDISRGGLFINTRKPLPVGTAVRVLVQLPQRERPIDLGGRVTRVAEVGNAVNTAPGMAVEFTDLDGARRRELEELVDRLRTVLDPD
ncbi:TIGR02266 family protein [Anaeromyxobacter paludicola]|uniref:PilZ domain-containing protein n=1 Tax=Anaeromyxobacter paludicola TaxID=2918171 RepID=A0ABM7X619_9BACT|nr:TIGR02266 family protein [Anaeromyxobacter paludicola]BDG07259.1 hypothetical protein AMPC_03720 [Anaeromyxobacter paludicola]